MTWHGIHGHDDVVERFRRAIGRGRLASSFLFVGPSGIGKRSLALKLAQAMLCRTHPEEALDPCGRCAACVQAAAGTHPDLQLVSKPEGKAEMPLELLIGDPEHRGRRGLCHDLSLKPFMGGRKIAVIDDADDLNVEGANSLLKTLEEPPPRSVLILIGTSEAKQLPTIRSRCQSIRFRPLPDEVVAELLVSRGLVEDAAEARRLAGYSGGSIEQALALVDPGLWTFRADLFRWLARPVLETVRTGRAVLDFVEAAGKEASARRARARQTLAFAAEFYRGLMYALAGLPPGGDAPLRQAVQEASRSWPGDSATAAACAERTLEAAEQIDRMAHQATALECWLDDLAQTLLPPRSTLSTR